MKTKLSVTVTIFGFIATFFHVGLSIYDAFFSEVSRATLSLDSTFLFLALLFVLVPNPFGKKKQDSSGK